MGFGEEGGEDVCWGWGDWEAVLLVDGPGLG